MLLACRWTEDGPQSPHQPLQRLAAGGEMHLDDLTGVPGIGATLRYPQRAYQTVRSMRVTMPLLLSKRIFKMVKLLNIRR